MEDNNKTINDRTVKVQDERYVPRCPTCQSPNLSKIPNSERIASAVLFGLYSQKMRKTYHCNNCGYEW
jgi:uncharacterized protein with PIN domain